VLKSFPANRPDLPVSYFSQFLFSSEYIEKVSRYLALNIYTAVTNLKSSIGRICLASGALKNRDVRNVASRTCLPIFALQSTEDLFVDASSINDVIGEKKSIFQIWSHQIQHDVHQKENCYAKVRLGDKIRSIFLKNGLPPNINTDKKNRDSQIDGISGQRVTIFVRGGHLIMQECKWAAMDLLDLLACPLNCGECNDLGRTITKSNIMSKVKRKGKRSHDQRNSTVASKKKESKKSPSKSRHQHEKVRLPIENPLNTAASKNLPIFT